MENKTMKYLNHELLGDLVKVMQKHGRSHLTVSEIRAAEPFVHEEILGQYENTLTNEGLKVFDALLEFKDVDWSKDQTSLLKSICEKHKHEFDDLKARRLSMILRLAQELMNLEIRDTNEYLKRAAKSQEIKQLAIDVFKEKTKSGEIDVKSISNDLGAGDGEFHLFRNGGWNSVSQDVSKDTADIKNQILHILNSFKDGNISYDEFKESISKVLHEK